MQFKLPNIITPGIEDENNDVLTTFPDNENYRSDCSRSVLQVDLKRFSRWGIEIFATSITSQDSPVFWNGLNAAGREVSSGTYFYQAQVTFDTSNPAQRNQQVKGWVQVLR
ncbi:MAG: gliding motility-associated C-terminal domain-containing protein [Cyclobacteriaceae bacterium]